MGRHVHHGRAVAGAHGESSLAEVIGDRPAAVPDERVLVVGFGEVNRFPAVLLVLEHIFRVVGVEGLDVHRLVYRKVQEVSQ